MAERIKINSLEVGQNYRGELLVLESQIKQASNGPYVMLKLTDGESKIIGKRWKNDTKITPGVVMNFVVEVGSWNGQKDLNIKGWSAGELTTEDFYTKGPVPKSVLYAELSSLMNLITDDHYRDFVEYLFQAYEQEIDKAPAAKSVHHNYTGGWLQHTTEVATLAYQMAITMRTVAAMDINISLVLAGAMLHDIGKIRGYSFNQGVSDLTDDGKLFEHISLGMLMLTEAQEHLKTPKVYYDMLLHCICSHHGKLEWGSPVTPATIEAQIIHLADLTSSNCTTMNELRSTGDAMWSDKSYSLGRQVYKGPVEVSGTSSPRLVIRRCTITEQTSLTAEKLRANDGYCPCALEKTPDTKCMCKNFREQKGPGVCHCGLFEKVWEENDELPFT